MAMTGAARCCIVAVVPRVCQNSVCMALLPMPKVLSQEEFSWLSCVCMHACMQDFHVFVAGCGLEPGVCYAGL